jgi:phosphate starvation-inducible PhoH-like protein
MLGFKETNQLIERNIIEVVPLAFMRGRTLNDSFIILDESQNATVEQMKMFLTRFGFGSKVVVTGDITQIDLPKNTQSGLVHSLDVLKGLSEVGFIKFDSKDIVRHGLVQKIVEAYEEHN